MPRSAEEILPRLRDLIHRHRRRFLKRNLRPCPENCEKATEVGRKVIGCKGCASRNPDHCNNPNTFVPFLTKEELYVQFKEDIRDPEVLVRDYRDIAILFWVLGIDPLEDEQIVAKVEDRKE
jgi:hypothetical protein